MGHQQKPNVDSLIPCPIGGHQALPAVLPLNPDVPQGGRGELFSHISLE